MIKKIDHIVITTSNIDNCIGFYKKLEFKYKCEHGRHELYAGDFKINVHIKGNELEPKAQNVQTGSSDLCFEVNYDIELFRKQLLKENINIELGIVDRNGVNGIMKSIYLRDPDGNLIEFCSYK